MEDYQLLKVLSEPEGAKLEFKEKAPNPDIMGRIISAFSNSDGGTILLGVGSKGAVFGVKNIDDAKTTISKALDLIKPRPAVKTHVETVDGKSVIVIDIKKSEEAPHAVNNLLYQRDGTSVVPVDSASLYTSITEHSNVLSSVQRNIMRLTDVIENQNKQLMYDQGWRAKLPDMLIGGLIGAAISLLIQFLI